ncbi:hypothetical protein N7527_012024 [Penicillium freii]|nr:hypothetical protein N7527_012024 [Penicillium freii]
MASLNRGRKTRFMFFGAKMRTELKNPHYHTYHKTRRVWVRKPFPGEVPLEAIKPRSTKSAGGGSSSGSAKVKS